VYAGPAGPVRADRRQFRGAPDRRERRGPVHASGRLCRRLFHRFGCAQPAAVDSGGVRSARANDARGVARGAEGREIREYVEQSRRRLFALLQPRIPVRTRVEFDNHSSKSHTVIDVETGDRTGLLYDIVRSMAENGLDISTARIAFATRSM
jgi:hypothetical protein